MKCCGQGFTTCDHSKIVYRPCGPGTYCRQWNGALFCDYEKNAKAASCPTEGALKCNGQGFSKCDHGKWVDFACAPGTSCKGSGQCA